MIRMLAGMAIMATALLAAPAAAEPRCVMAEAVIDSLGPAATAVHVLNPRQSQALADALSDVRGLGRRPVAMMLVFVRAQLAVVSGFDGGACQIGFGVLPLAVFRELWQRAGLDADLLPDAGPPGDPA